MAVPPHRLVSRQSASSCPQDWCDLPANHDELCYGTLGMVHAVDGEFVKLYLQSDEDGQPCFGIDGPSSILLPWSQLASLLSHAVQAHKRWLEGGA